MRVGVLLVVLIALLACEEAPTATTSQVADYSKLPESSVIRAVRAMLVKQGGSSDFRKGVTCLTFYDGKAKEGGLWSGIYLGKGEWRVRFSGAGIFDTEWKVYEPGYLPFKPDSDLAKQIAVHIAVAPKYSLMRKNCGGGGFIDEEMMKVDW